MKFIKLIVVFLLLSVSFQIRAKSKALSKSGSKINIGSMFKYMKKYWEFSQTKWGAFMNGFFLGIITDIVDDKAAVKCEADKFWQLIQCLVGGADVTLDQYYANLKVPDYKNLPDTSVASLNESVGEADKLDKDKEVTDTLKQIPKDTKPAPAQSDNSWYGYLKSTWESGKNLVQGLIDKVKAKLDGYWGKVSGFFTSPVFKGLTEVAKCVIPLNHESIANTALKATFTFLGVPYAEKLLNIVKKAPLIFTTFKDIFFKLKGIYNGSYKTEQEKYYNWGKGLGNSLETIVRIYNSARRMKRFRSLFAN